MRAGGILLEAGCPQGSRLGRPCGAHGAVHVSPHSLGPRSGQLEVKLVPAGHMDMSMCHPFLWAPLGLYVISGCPQGSRLVRPCGAHGGVHVSPHSLGPRSGLLEVKLVPAGHMDMSMCHPILWAPHWTFGYLVTVCQLYFASLGPCPYKM